MKITKEEFIKMFKADEEGNFEVKEWMNEAGIITLDAHRDILAGDVQKLKDKNSEILGEKKKLSETIKSITANSEKFNKVIGILKDYEFSVENSEQFDFDKFEEFIAERKASGSGSGDSAETALKLKRAERDLTMKTRELEELKGYLSKTEELYKNSETFINKKLLESDFIDELTKAGYKPVIIKKLIPSLLLDSGATVEVAEDDPFNRKVVTKDGESIADFVKFWIGTEEGKAFLPAPANTGGGSGHSGSAGIAGKKWTELSLTEKSTLYDTDRPRYDKLYNEHLSTLGADKY